MTEVAILIGLQASGKTTFYRAVLAATHVHVSKDAFPKARHRQARQLRLIGAALDAHRDVAVDNTNPSAEEWRPIMAAGRERGARVAGYWFPPDLAGSRERNASRDAETRVPDVGLYATLKRLRRPRLADGFDELFTVRFDGRGGFLVGPGGMTMLGAEFEAGQRAREWFHTLTVPVGAWLVVRVDGRGFSRFTERHFAKPFDEGFSQLMVETAQALLTEFDARYAYTESDEISVVLDPRHDPFGRKVEKIVSISAGVASAAFTHAAGQPAHFDSRVWMGTGVGDVLDYVSWRQADATRCALNGWCYWTLRKAGASRQEATRRLHGTTTSDKNELLFQHGINFNDLPAWQRRGIGLWWETHRGVEVATARRHLRTERDLPAKGAYRALVDRLIGGAEPEDAG